VQKRWLASDSGGGGDGGCNGGGGSGGGGGGGGGDEASLDISLPLCWQELDKVDSQQISHVKFTL
jgi:hypothetical protein